MKRERVANNAQSPKKRARQKSSQGKNSPGSDLPAMHVARIYIPLPRPYVTGKFCCKFLFRFLFQISIYRLHPYPDLPRVHCRCKRLDS